MKYFIKIKIIARIFSHRLEKNLIIIIIPFCKVFLEVKY